MKRIPLTQGKEALVSDCDYEFLMRWGWYYRKAYKGGYAVRHDENNHDKIVWMHKEVARRKGLSGQIDHRNQNKVDDRRHNLREATGTQNKANSSLYRNNTSKYRGVSPYKNRWRATCKRAFFGDYSKTKTGKIQAAYAYDIAALACFKRFAVLNKVSHLLDDSTKRWIKKDVLRRLKEKGLI